MTGSEALGPNPALRPFEVLIGEWRTTGTHPLMPGTTYHGRTAFTWHEGGAFLLMRSEMDQSEIPNGVAIFGSDDAAGTFVMVYFDERGVSRKYDVTLTGNQLTWMRDEAGFAQRNTLVIDPDGSRMVGIGEMSRADGAWEGDLSLTYNRIKCRTPIVGRWLPRGQARPPCANNPREQRQERRRSSSARAWSTRRVSAPCALAISRARSAVAASRWRERRLLRMAFR
jgi:hypothetical protein